MATASNSDSDSDDGYQSDHNTPLHNAVSYNYKDLTRTLLRDGANPNEKNRFGQTSLHEAILSSRIELGLLLIKHGADITIVDNNNNTPLDYLQDRDIPGNQEEYFQNPEAYYNPERVQEKYTLAATLYKNNKSSITTRSQKKRALLLQDNNFSKKNK